jgi:hypothetical protein
MMQSSVIAFPQQGQCGAGASDAAGFGAGRVPRI